MALNQKLLQNSDDYIAYNQYKSKSDHDVGIMFLGGLKSSMEGTKALSLAAYAEERDYDYIRFDYFGHGMSPGEFTQGTISKWLDNCLNILDSLCHKKQILVGSSLGGWLMLLAAQLRPHKICGLIGIAPAPDFTEELIIPHLSSAQQEELSLQGLIDFAAGECEESYPISAQLLSDAKDHLVLTKPLNINLPVRLIHGQLDQDVPYKYSLRLSELLQSSDVTISLIKSGHHNLSSPDALSHIHHIISELMSLCSSSIK